MPNSIKETPILTGRDAVNFYEQKAVEEKFKKKRPAYTAPALSPDTTPLPEEQPLDVVKTTEEILNKAVTGSYNNNDWITSDLGDSHCYAAMEEYADQRIAQFATDAGGGLSQLRQHNEFLKQAINQDKTGLAKGLADVRQLLKGYHWVTEGRGPYAYDDERYKGEVLNMINDIDEVALKALQESGTLATAAFHKKQALSTHSSSEMVSVEKVIELIKEYRPKHPNFQDSIDLYNEELITQILTIKR